MRMAHFEIEATWSGKTGNRRIKNTVGASDACEALELATPASYKRGQFDECFVSIRPVPDKEK